MQERVPLRAGSEPPQQEASNANGLRRPHAPIRLAGVSMGGGSIGSGIDLFGVGVEQSCAASRGRCASGSTARNNNNGLNMPFGSVASAPRKRFGGGGGGGGLRRRSSSVENIVRMLEALSGNCAEQRCDSPDGDLIAVEPEQVNYHGPRPAPIFGRCQSTEGIMEDLTTAGDADDCTSISCSSSKIFEELFVAVDSEEECVTPATDLTTPNPLEYQCTVENLTEEKTAIVENKITQQPEFVTSESEESASESVSTSSKLALKRQRNLTLDFHDLAPSVWTTYNGQVAKYTQKVYLRADEEAAEAEAQHSEDSLGLGLGIILDKLKNIEIKLDEIKALEENNGVCTIAPTESTAESGRMDQLELRDKSCNTSPCSLRTAASNEEEASAVATSSQGDSAACVTAEMLETADDEFTLIEENDSVVSECSHTEVVQQLESDQDSDNAVAESPVMSETASDAAQKAPQGFVTITSAASSSSVEHNNEDDGEDNYDSESRLARIERLAAQFLKPQQQPPPEPSGGLETLSERSEDERESDPPSERRPRQLVTVTRRRSRRTRSSSRDRALAKIRFCWRCHQTGHESFDCEAKLHPGNWCPRCLEDSHWEDDCWVSHKQVLCSRCTLPGHLPCVHETSDFRQRKLIIETFGWLAFKDWFRDPDFWSWWNVSGFTNVPLYKLMQQCRR